MIAHQEDIPIIEYLPEDGRVSLSAESVVVELSVDVSSGTLVTGVIVFSYNTLPSIFINLMVSSPSSETEA
jgi:hypothetical protein